MIIYTDENHYRTYYYGDGDIYTKPMEPLFHNTAQERYDQLMRTAMPNANPKRKYSKFTNEDGTITVMQYWPPAEGVSHGAWIVEVYKR